MCKLSQDNEWINNTIFKDYSRRWLDELLEGEESLSVRKVMTDNDGWSSNGSLKLVKVVTVSQDVVA